MERRAGKCKVCLHREATAVNVALARGVSVRALSKRYTLSVDSLYRHARRHLPPQLKARLIAGPALEGVDLECLMQTESQSLLAHLVGLRNRLFASLDVAEESGDSGMVARISSQLHANFEIVGKLLGDLAAGSTTVNNILIAPQFIELRAELVQALKPFPAARQAVASVLHRLESKAADTIIDGKARELAK